MDQPVEALAPPAPERPRRRIVYSLVIMLAIVGVVPFAGFSMTMIHLNREELKTAHQEHQLLLAQSIARDVDVQVEGLCAELVRVAQTLGAGTGRRTLRQEQLLEVLADVADERLALLRYSYIVDDRFLDADSSEIPPVLEPLFAEGVQRIVGTSRRDMDERGIRSVVSEPVVVGQTPPQALVIVSAPVRSGNRLRGVLSAVVDLQRVWAQTAARNPTGHALYLADSHGKVLASTDPVTYRPGYHYGSPLFERFRGQEGRSRETLPFRLEENGRTEDYLGSYEATRERWGVFAVARARDVYAPVRRLIRNTAVSALSALAIAVFAAALFARTLSNPINRLVDATRAFTRGDFSYRVDVNSANEIGHLAGTFNRMAAQIEDHIQRLYDAAEENNQLFLGTIRALAQAIDAKDPYTRGHSLRVNRYSVIIARHLGLPEDEVKQIYVSSLLHDIGKIGIDDAVLKKPGRLTDAEFEVIKRHPVLGAEIMAPIPHMKQIIPGLRWHHEKWAGGGYPDGLIGEQIPLMARIIAVADTFDAMTTHRPYQTAMTYAAALHRINTVLKGMALDPQVVEAFNMACELGRIRPRAELAKTESQTVEAIRA